jgi:hypothetical protein
MTTDYREMHTHIRLRDGFFNPDMLYETDMIDEVFLELDLYHYTIIAIISF